MKVLIVGLGGVTHTFRHWPERVLALALQRRGHRVWAIGTHDPKRPALANRFEVIEGVEVTRVRSGYAPNRQLAEALRRMPRPDVVHLMHPRNVLAAQATAWARKHAIPTVYTWLGPFHDAYATTDRERPYEAASTFERLAFTRRDLLRVLLLERRPRDALRNYRLHSPLYHATALAPCSQFEAEIMRRFGLRQPQEVVPLWIDSDFIRSTPVERFDAGGASSASNAELAQKLATLPRPWLLFVGQLTLRKGYDVAIEALPRIVQQLPGTSLLIVSGINQAQREQVLSRARELGVVQHVHILGYLSDGDLINVYRASDALLFPTRFEGFGLPLLEAMAAECPVITTDIPVVNEIVQNQENGILVPYADGMALADAAVAVCGDGNLRRRLVRGGLATVEQRYDEGVLVGKIERLYSEALKR